MIKKIFSFVLRYFLERYTVCCGTVLIGKVRDTKQFGLRTVLLNHIHYMERFHLKKYSKKYFSYTTSPQKFLLFKKWTFSSCVTRIFSPLKKNPGSATAVWIKIILNITKLIELIFLQRIKTSLKGTSRNLYQIFQFRLSEVYLLLVLFPLNLPCQTGRCLGVGGSILFLDCSSILYTIYEIIASSSWDLPTCKL